MKQNRIWPALLASLLLIAVLAGCSSSGPAAPAIDDKIVVDLLWNYEMHLIDAVKGANPAQYVTDLEAKWLEQFLAAKAAGKKPQVGWMTSGSTMVITKQSAREAEVKIQWPLESGKLQSVLLKLKPVEGVWKVANHTDTAGKWWAPAK